MSSEPRARFAYPELDRVLHERARLGILSCLISCNAAVTFADLKALCDLTDGNLSRHLKALEEAGIVLLDREEKEGVRPTTWIGFTKGGRKRFLDYVDVLEAIVRNSTAHTNTVAKVGAKGGRRAPAALKLAGGRVGGVPA